MSSAAEALLRTPLHALHHELGARLVPFAGYELPVQYSAGLLAEHRHTREAASLFDVSHMGQIRLHGPQAAAALETLLPQDILGLATGQQRYGLLLADDGGILDDLMVVQRGGDLLLVVNGACRQADLAHIRQRIGAACAVEPLPQQALLALQGPLAAGALARLAPGAAGLRFLRGGFFTLDGADCYVTRSGYTGEDGFEISVPAGRADALARALLAQPGVAPAGLGARNSLRLEAGLCLYGNDINATTTPAEAALGWAIQKVRRPGGARAGGFPGAGRVLAELEAQQQLAHVRVGLAGLDRVPVREPAQLLDAAGRTVGRVTSGLPSPTLGIPIALASVEPRFAAPGRRVDASVRGRRVPLEVRATPFVPTRYYRG
ncbi:glycine cleavage system aminomethyltransferase GcvT [Xylophilus sp.]|uniref:glycine cleavage system aminomethyltransferase GcvT n=1 Tax=Xylophilus sp. TaxID=2653893 RepID=UPI0013B82FD3|nr:glycine cleavage system aminomethyltransferase GcvT [Xylophilus sp.]KAF1047196.1 MAG: Aminomethyltransferase [Xylophilus sp.]